MWLVRSILANLCPIMIHFNALDFNVCRSKEVCDNYVSFDAECIMALWRLPCYNRMFNDFSQQQQTILIFLFGNSTQAALELGVVCSWQTNIPTLSDLHTKTLTIQSHFSRLDDFRSLPECIMYKQIIKDKYTHNTCQIYVKPHTKNTQITLESQIFDALR